MQIMVDNNQASSSVISCMTAKQTLTDAGSVLINLLLKNVPILTNHALKIKFTSSCYLRTQL